MEREKKALKRPGSKVKPLHVSDFIALGSKSAGRQADDPKAKALLPKEPAAKKAKLATAKQRTPARKEGTEWETIAVEVEPGELVAKVLEAEDMGDDDRVEALVCGAVKKLRLARAPPLLYLALSYVAKARPFLLASGAATEALCSLLRPSAAATASRAARVLAANLLLAAHRDESAWPEALARAYVEDALAERAWVDHELCRAFVDNVLTAFNTRPVPREEEATSEATAAAAEATSVFPRFVYSEESLAQHVVEVFREQMSRRQPSEVSRNTLRFLASTCGIGEIRLGVAQRLEVWLQNPKLAKPAQELLLALCLNCTRRGDPSIDAEVIGQLVKVRLKAKPLLNHLLSCARELLAQHPDNLASLLKHAVYNELSGAGRGPNNLPLVACAFAHAPERAAQHLAEVFAELVLQQREDYLRALRGLLREVARATRLPLHAFCAALLRPPPDPVPAEVRERAFLAFADLVSLAVLVGAATRREPRAFQLQSAKVQKEAVRWLHGTAPRAFSPSRAEFVHAMHKMLFVEQVEHYCNKDNWPGEGERMTLLRLASEVPLLQDTLVKVLLTGLSRDHPLSPPEALELADQLVRRAAAAHADAFPVLEFDNTELCEIIFNLCAYHHPENYTLPQGYHPPNLAISELYWKAWTMLLVIVCHNPATFGDMAWKTCPMLRHLMEMCITNQFVFPPPTLGEKADELVSRELQMSAMEREEIVAFESHLAGTSITEGTSLLVPKLISMDPHGPARRPPPAVLEQLRALSAKLRLGDLLCRSRRPDFLLEVIQRPGQQSLSWLGELVEASAFDMLPVQCLCEFLVQQQPPKRRKQEQLLQHLRHLLETGEARDTVEVVGYFVKRLGSQQSSARSLALQGLDLLLRGEGVAGAWLGRCIPRLPHFSALRPQLSAHLRQACQIESEPAAVAAYVAFLAQHTQDEQQEFADLALDLAQMIVERPTVVNSILVLPSAGDFLAAVADIFFKYLAAARTPSKEVYSWSESQDQILIQWSSGESATLHILVVHAMIIVLTYGPPPSSLPTSFDALLGAWFADPPPKAFLVDTSEEALLLPDWLKLRMIRSPVGALVEAALRDLDPSQLVLFIQSFGIPVASMSRLLRTLDLAVEVDAMAVEQAVLDKGYMSQLVEVQHRRGATGGHKFSALLLSGEGGQPEGGGPSSSEETPSTAALIQRAPALPAAPVASDAAAAALLRLLGLGGGSPLSARQEQELFQGLRKALAQDVLGEGGAVGVFVLACEQLLRGADSKAPFLQALHRKSHYSSVLFRLATASKRSSTAEGDPLSQKLRWICQQVIYTLPPCPLVTVCSHFFHKRRPKEARPSAPWRRRRSAGAEGVEATVRAAEAEDPLRLEEVMQHLVRGAISRGDAKPLMRAMTDITIKRLTEDATPPATINRSKFCFFVDWLECLEPKIASSFPSSDTSHLQSSLLFSVIRRQGSPIAVPFRPYLLALLVHQSSWEVLHSCIAAVLDPGATAVDPTSALDFLHACARMPRIRHHASSGVLALEAPQARRLARYILEEGGGGGRVPLLMEALAERPALVEEAVRFLLGELEGERGEAAQELLLQAYHRIPAILTTVSGAAGALLSAPPRASPSHCRLDALAHSLLLSLARTDASKPCLAKMARIEFVLKKMAATHAPLLLRQLPMAAALLRGRSHLDYRAFRSHNHLALFGATLGLLELLGAGPAADAGHLHPLLDLYVEAFAAYGAGPKEMSALMTRFAAFLAQLASARPAVARAFSRHHGEALAPELRAALAGMPPAPGQLPPSLAARLGAPEEVAQALQELEVASHKRPALIEHVADSLQLLMQDPSPQVRGSVFNLVMRYVKHSPGQGVRFLSSFLQCLESEQVEVVLAALEHLPEFTVLVQEFAPLLLQKAFNIGMVKGVNTAPQIRATISYLVAQSGC